MDETEVVTPNGVTPPPPEDKSPAAPAAEPPAAGNVPQEDQEARPATSGKTSASLREAWRQVETVGQALGEALQGRGNVVMVRVNDEALHHLDMLVEAEITKSRSESAALLISEGIKANQALFERIAEITRQIADLRAQLRREVAPETRAEG